MATIAYITNGMASTLNSGMELARRLTDRGHEVVFVSHRDLSQSCAAAGFRFIQLAACQQIRDEFDRRLDEAGSRRSLLRRWRAVRISRSYRRRAARNTEIEDRLREIGAELLLIDIELHYAILATRHLNLPTLLPIVWFSIFRRPGLPPLHTALMPATGWRGVWRIRLAWWRLLAGRALQLTVGSWRPRRIANRVAPFAYGTRERADLRAVARARQISMRAETDWTQWLHPHVYPRLTVLCFNAWELEFPHDPPESIRYTGPMVSSQRTESQTSPEAYREWESFCKSCQDAGQTIVYCSLGTFWNAHTDFLRRVVHAFDGRDDRALVIGLGGTLSGKQLDIPASSENILVLDYAPQLEILCAAGAAITHGGITTINECIRHAVPMLVCSTGHVDQDGCQARVEYHGLGLAAGIDSATSQDLGDLLDQLINDEQIRSNLQNMRSVLAGYEQQGTAVQVIEQCLGAHPAANHP